MFLALYVYERFTSLGDTRSYITSAPFVLDAFSSTNLMRFWATFFFFLVEDFANFPFVLLSFLNLLFR